MTTCLGPNYRVLNRQALYLLLDVKGRNVRARDAGFDVINTDLLRGMRGNAQLRSD